MNIEGIKGSIDLSTENVFNQLDALEGRLNKFAQSRGNDGEIIANEMKTIVNVMAGSQIEFADNLKKAFDALEQQHIKYGQKARRIEKDVTKALVAEMVNRNQAFAQSYAQTQMDYLEQLNRTNAAYEALTKSKIADRADRADYRETQRIKQAELEADKLISDQADEVFARSMAQLKMKQQAINDQAEARMIEFRASKKASEEAARVEIKNQKAQEAAMKASLAKRIAMFRSFGGVIASIAKGIVWFPVIANQTIQMFQGVGYTLKAIWDSVYGTIIDVNSEVENYMTRLRVSTGSLLGAKKVWEDIKKYATESVFTFQETVQASTSLLPILRGGREELKKWLPIIGDLAAAFGLTYEEAAANFGKFYSAGAGAADLFRDRGILPAIGIKPGEKISGPDSAKALEKAFNSEFSVFRGAATELNKNWSGIVSQLKDQWFLFVNDLGNEDIFAKFKQALSVVLDKFKDLRESGDAYKKLLKDISNALVKIAETIFAVVTGFFNFIMKIPVLGSSIQAELDKVNVTDAQKKQQERIDKLVAQKNEIEGNGGIKWVSAESQKQLDEINKKLAGAYAVYKVLGEGTTSYDMGDSLEAMVSEIRAIFNEEPVEVKVNLIAQFKSDEAQYLRDQAIKTANNKKILDDRMSEVNAAKDKVSDKLAEARINSIKYSQGEWAAFVAETEIEAGKIGDKIKKSLGADSPEGISEAAKAAGAFISAELSGKIAEYKYELMEMTRATQNEISKLGMTGAEASRFDIDNEFSDVKWKGQSDEVQKEMAIAKQAKIDLLEEQEARRKNNETLSHEQKLRLDLIPSWDSYGLRLAEISNEYDLATQGATDLAIAEALLNKKRLTEQLDSNTVKAYREEIDELLFTTSQFGMSDLEKETSAFNRALDRLVNSDFAKKYPELVAQLKELKELDFKQSQVVTFTDGWNGAMTDIKNSTMTEGQAIKTFMTDIFSELSSTLSDVFFKVFKGELKDAAEAFEAFADAIMKSIADIMANQIAGQMMSGAMGMMGSLFHSGGVVGSGGTNGRRVSPMAFLGAPKMHTGGIVGGLKSDERAAILQTGERVLPRGWEKNSGGGISVNIKNESGESLKITQSRASQDMSGWVISVVLDAVQRDRGGLRTALGGR